eukprot:scaffold19168_cov107-Isochrysis_galbana.AAC.4
MECHRRSRSRGRAIAPASSSHRRWKAGLALSPAPGSCRPPSAAQRAVGAPSFDQPRARKIFFSRNKNKPDAWRGPGTRGDVEGTGMSIRGRRRDELAWQGSGHVAADLLEHCMVDNVQE